MYVSSLISLAPLTPGNVTEQGPGMNTRYSQPMILQVIQRFRIHSSNQHAQSCYHVFNKTLVWGCWEAVGRICNFTFIVTLLHLNLLALVTHSISKVNDSPVRTESLGTNLNDLRL